MHASCKAAKPVLAEKGTHYLLGVFIQENDVFVYFSDEMGEHNLVSTVKLQNYTPCLGIFPAKPYPMFRGGGVFEKVTHH